ncbi:MAG: CDP-alcohol phosphatidyltransferase family protein [Rhodospirillales bacterium]
MLDAALRRLIDPALKPVAAAMVRAGASADAVTIGGFAIGMLSLPAIAAGQFGLALLAIAINRLSDGLDGAIARITRQTDRGGYLDIVCDFIFYAGSVFGFALADQANALPAAFLIFSFMGTGSSFLAYAIMAAKRGMSTDIRGSKSLYYLGGITEGTETIAFLVAICLWPAAFPMLAWGFGALCWVTTASRILAAWRSFD